MKKLLFILFLSVNNVFGSIEQVKSYAITALPHLLYVMEPLSHLRTYANTKNILAQHYKKVEHAKLLKFLKEECSKITDKEINFHIGYGYYFGTFGMVFAFAVGNEDIVILPDYYALLEQIFNKTELSEQDKRALNILRFILNHEVNHLEQKHIKKRIAASFAITIAKMIGFECAKSKLSFKGSWVGSWMILGTIGNLLLVKLNKQQEHAADDQIQGADAIAGGKQLLTNLINQGKANPEVALAMQYNFTHPTPEDRLQRLEARC